MNLQISAGAYELISQLMETSAKLVFALGLGGYDLTADGKRAVVLMPAGTPESQLALNHAIFLEHFFDEVRRRCR